jgi:hypothetical protein
LADLLQEVIRVLLRIRTGWLAGALLLCSQSSQAAFSHRVHLAQKLECVVCHSIAPSSSKASDNLLPAPEVCLNCHTGERALPATPAIKAPRKLTVTKFNHSSHLKLGNIAAMIVRAIDAKTYLSDPGDLRSRLASVNHPCIACHRGLETSDAVTAAAFPRMADCLVCHNQVDPPFSCVKCHDENANLKPASHTAGWIDRHSSGKANLDKPSCAVCHGRRFTCLGCH